MTLDAGPYGFSLHLPPRQRVSYPLNVSHPPHEQLPY